MRHAKHTCCLKYSEIPYIFKGNEKDVEQRRGTSCAIPYETSIIKFAPHVQVIGYKRYIIKIEKKTIDHKNSISKYCKKNWNENELVNFIRLN